MSPINYYENGVRDIFFEDTFLNNPLLGPTLVKYKEGSGEATILTPKNMGVSVECVKGSVREGLGGQIIELSKGGRVTFSDYLGDSCVFVLNDDVETPGKEEVDLKTSMQLMVCEVY